MHSHGIIAFLNIGSNESMSKAWPMTPWPNFHLSKLLPRHQAVVCAIQFIICNFKLGSNPNQPLLNEHESSSTIEVWSHPQARSKTSPFCSFRWIHWLVGHKRYQIHTSFPCVGLSENDSKLYTNFEFCKEKIK